MTKHYTYAYIFANRESMIDYWKNAVDKDWLPLGYEEISATIQDHKGYKVTVLTEQGSRHDIHLISPDGRPDWLFQNLCSKQLTAYKVMNGEEWTAQEISYMNSRIRNPCGRDVE